jgi:hypothetical protein
MKAKLFGLVASLVLLGAIPSQAAPLVDLGNNTYDPNTGLQWLDVTLTNNHSYNDIVANYLGVGDPYYGYRYATGAEVSTLFTDAGITNPYAGPINGNAPAILNLISLLGATVPGPNNPSTFGITGDLDGTNVFVAGLQVNNPKSSQLAMTDFAEQDQSVSGLVRGSFLVEVVGTTPLPAALPLFASGLGALGPLGWRRKRKAKAA